MAYQQLPSKSSTRLLRLLPGAPTAPIKTSLFVVDLAQQHPGYEAVSYCWGRKGVEHDIGVNGQLIPIWANLYQCLLRLRSLTQERLLWIDALSISQSDLAEKSQQVQIIGNIFRQAVRVLAWLGECADGSENLFQPSPDTFAKSSFFDHVKHSFGFSKQQQQVLLRRAKQWCLLFHRPYFVRTWIVQEIALAKSILVQCGADSMDWTELISQRMQRSSHFDGLAVNTTIIPRIPKSTSIPSDNDIRNLSRLADALDTLFAIMQPIRILQEVITGKYREMVGGDYKPFDYNIFGIAQMFAYTECSMHMDRIYATQSLERRQLGCDPIPVDYAAGMPALVVSLYAYRYVLPATPSLVLKSSTWGSEGLDAASKARQLIYALRLTRDVCQQILDVLATKIRDEDDEELGVRWNHVFDTFRLAANSVADLAYWDTVARDGRGLPVLGLHGEKYQWV